MQSEVADAYTNLRFCRGLSCGDDLQVWIKDDHRIAFSVVAPTAPWIWLICFAGFVGSLFWVHMLTAGWLKFRAKMAKSNFSTIISPYLLITLIKMKLFVLSLSTKNGRPYFGKG